MPRWQTSGWPLPSSASPLRESKVLQSGEYTVRANAMIEARRLVGGVMIEDASKA